MHFSSTFVSLLSLSLPFAAQAATHGEPGRRHQDIARRARSDVNVFEKRSFSNARFTYYDVGLGACGKNNVASDFIVALNTPQFGSGYPGPNCFKSITITWGGKTTQATIMDECPGCPYGGLDFSRGLFDYFADESVGVLYGEWWFDDDAPAPSTTEKPSPTTTWTPEPTTTKYTPTTTWTPEPTTTWSPEPTTTWTPEPTTTWSSSSSVWTPPPSSSSTHHSSSSSSSWSSSVHSSSSFSSSATPSSSSVKPSSTSSSVAATPTTAGTLDTVNQAFIGVAGLLVAGAAAQ